ncbi:hypothetical protein [Streptomyces sp. NPDC007264]|uniref:hypothetical protein n=1 Tax=Streptomyces sp. NPDC007264 TaxID=3364777 RepID=UPI0036D84B96
MFHHELHRIRSTELIRQAEAYRLRREVLRRRPAARTTGQDPEPEDRTDGPGRSRLVRAA